jgi:hypothetical protein
MCDAGDCQDSISNTPVNAPFGKRTKVFSVDGKTVSTLRKNTDLTECFSYWADLQGF